MTTRAPAVLKRSVNAAHKAEVRSANSHWHWCLAPLTSFNGKKFRSEKPKHIWAKIGQNWPQWALRIMKIIRARERRRVRGLVFLPFYLNWNFMRACWKTSSRSDQQMPSNLSKPFPHCKFAAKHLCWARSVFGNVLSFSIWCMFTFWTCLVPTPSSPHHLRPGEWEKPKRRSSSQPWVHNLDSKGL